MEMISKDALFQNSIGLAVLIIVGLIFWPLAPKPNPDVSGIYLPNATEKAPISPDQVQVLQVMPPKAEIMGIINTKLYYNSLAESAQNEDITASLNYAKSLAAQAGANGIVIKEVGASMSQGPLNGVVVYGTAVSL